MASGLAPHAADELRRAHFSSLRQATSSAGGTEVKNLGDGLIRTLTQLRGNRDSFSMYGWGDNNHVAYVSYDLLPSNGGR